MLEALHMKPTQFSACWDRNEHPLVPRTWQTWSLIAGLSDSQRSCLFSELPHNWLLWNKTHILWQDKKNVNKDFSLPFGPLCPPSVQCAPAPCIHQTSLRQKYPLSRKSNILASTRQLLKKITFLLNLVKGHTDPWPTTCFVSLDLDCVNCQ